MEFIIIVNSGIERLEFIPARYGNTAFKFTTSYLKVFFLLKTLYGSRPMKQKIIRARNGNSVNSLKIQKKKFNVCENERN